MKCNNTRLRSFDAFSQSNKYIRPVYLFWIISEKAKPISTGFSLADSRRYIAGNSQCMYKITQGECV